ncbi:MAG TPA: NusG domain II-containing protein [Gammaproteobacteria bacterium]|nr:NusG domain II-containing protein [Gammaproteobacteria bacterium]
MMKIGDWLVIGLAAAALAAWHLAIWRGAPAPTEVHIRNAAGVMLRVPLDSPRRVEVAGRLGPSVIEIAGGRARFAASPCRNHVCLFAGWLVHAGEAAACLPNGVSIELAGAARRYDAVNF